MNRRENYLDSIAVKILKDFNGLSVSEAKSILSLVDANVEEIGKLKCEGDDFEKIISEHFHNSIN